jgi:hypothetical protein
MSNIHSAPVKDGKVQTRTRVEWNKVAAVVAWLGGTFTTYLFFASVAPELHSLIALGIAALAQWVLTMAERPLWRFLLRRKGGRFVLMAFIVTLFDGLLNAAGIYPHTSRLAQTSLGRMLAEVFNVAPTMDTRSAFIVAFFFGVVIAGLPEALWEYTDKG